VVASAGGVVSGVPTGISASTPPDEAELRAAERNANAGGTEIELILDRPDRRSVFVRDPDGMRFEFRCARPGRADLPSDVPAALRIYFLLRARFLDIDGIRTRVLYAGAGPALFLLHGVGVGGSTFFRNLD
jgi:hypothetical protein